jgi:hypothetical protein
MKVVATALFVICVTILTTSVAQAGGSPIQLALFNPVQIVPENESISGFRLSLLYGRNANMSGLDLGIVTNTTGNLTGVQWGLVSIVNGNAEGWQWNWVNMVDGSMSGLQMGHYSSSNHVKGVQFGLINNTVTIKGVQIGLINIIKKGGFMPVFPIANWGSSN